MRKPMALIIAIANLKGGVGKSTISIQLATCLHRAGHKSMIVDTDQQGTCAQWSYVASELEVDGPPVVAIQGQSLRRDLARVSESFDVVIVDAPGKLGIESDAAMLAAHCVLMPISPGAADIWALRQTLDRLSAMRDLHRPDLMACCVMNRADGRTMLSKLAIEAVRDSKIPLLKTSLGNRVAFGMSIAEGRGVVDHAPGSTAAKEIEALSNELLTFIEENNEQKRACG